MKQGSNHALYRAARTLDHTTGYIKITDPNGKRVIGEHRYKMELFLKRKLKSAEIVHHLNHDKTDNRIENLEIVSRSVHMAMHPKTIDRWSRKYDECIKCKSSDNKFRGFGLCCKCYMKKYYKNNRSKFTSN